MTFLFISDKTYTFYNSDLKKYIINITKYKIFDKYIFITIKKEKNMFFNYKELANEIDIKKIIFNKYLYYLFLLIEFLDLPFFNTTVDYNYKNTILPLISFTDRTITRNTYFIIKGNKSFLNKKYCCSSINRDLNYTRLTWSR
jgi:hypothetical protein